MIWDSKLEAIRGKSLRRRFATIPCLPSQLREQNANPTTSVYLTGIDRIKVDIIEPETSDDEDASEKRKASSPSKVLEKVKAYITENQLSADDGDSLWCVIDVDRWPQEQIEELHAFCAQKDNWHLVISNPCIEIWLLYHKRADLSDLGIQTAKDAKQALDRIEKGGYYYIKYLPLMLDAIENAQQADSNPDGYMPELLQTKVYQLGRVLYDRMGKVRFGKFVASLPSIEKEILKRKMRNTRK